MTGKVLITGGQQGIGLGIAQTLHDAGWDVALAAELPPDAEAVQVALASCPGARYFQHDLSDLSSVAALVAAVGPVTTLVSNAGVPAMRRGDLLAHLRQPMIRPCGVVRERRRATHQPCARTPPCLGAPRTCADAWCVSIVAGRRRCAGARHVLTTRVMV